MVQNVECIYADLPVQVLGDPGILRKRDIDIGKAGTDGHVPPQVSELVANSAAATYVSGHAAVENPGILQVSHVRGVPVGFAHVRPVPDVSRGSLHQSQKQ